MIFALIGPFLLVGNTESLPDEVITDDITDMEFDEMWHYIGKKNESCGSSRQ